MLTDLRKVTITVVVQKLTIARALPSKNIFLRPCIATGCQHGVHSKHCQRDLHSSVNSCNWSPGWIQHCNRCRPVRHSEYCQHNLGITWPPASIDYLHPRQQVINQHNRHCQHHELDTQLVASIISALQQFASVIQQAECHHLSTATGHSNSNRSTSGHQQCIARMISALQQVTNSQLQQ